MTPHTLAARCETAEPSETRALLEEAWSLIDDGSYTAWLRCISFTQRLDAEAYLDAAIWTGRGH